MPSHQNGNLLTMRLIHTRSYSSCTTAPNLVSAQASYLPSQSSARSAAPLGSWACESNAINLLFSLRSACLSQWQIQLTVREKRPTEWWSSVVQWISCSCRSFVAEFPSITETEWTSFSQWTPLLVIRSRPKGVMTRISSSGAWNGCLV